MRLGQEANLKPVKINEIIEQTKTALQKWEHLAINHGVLKTNIRFIKSRIM